ncbi:MAG TPA: VCBS repeat-containing protein [Fuerstia sp.]|nr:VCBS repeat-containing protein [Fuerstiella sp.]
MNGKIVSLTLVLVVLAGFVALRVIRTDQPAEPERQTSPSADMENGASAVHVTRSTEESPIRFTDVTQQSGIVFRYYGAPTPEQNMVEQNGGGVALLDLDGDTVLDVFLVNGSQFAATAEAVGASNQVFRATTGGAYDDVTVVAELQAFGFGMGCTVGDYDNDGNLDLFVGNESFPCQLFHNNGAGTFNDVAERAGVISSGAGIASAERRPGC